MAPSSQERSPGPEVMRVLIWPRPSVWTGLTCPRAGRGWAGQWGWSRASLPRPVPGRSTPQTLPCLSLRGSDRLLDLGPPGPGPEEVALPPLASGCPVPDPHRHLWSSGAASKPCSDSGGLRPGWTLALAVPAAKFLLLPGPPSPSSGKLVTAGPIPTDEKTSGKMLWAPGVGGGEMAPPGGGTSTRLGSARGRKASAHMLTGWARPAGAQDLGSAGICWGLRGLSPRLVRSPQAHGNTWRLQRHYSHPDVDRTLLNPKQDQGARPTGSLHLGARQ